MNWQFFIAWRHLRSRYRSSFISLISWFSVLGITIGVAALVIVLSVMNGFEEVVRDRIIGMDAHIRLRVYHNGGMSNYHQVMAQLDTLRHIEGISPYILDKGMIKCSGRSEAAVIRGLDPVSVSSVSDVRSLVVAGSLDFRRDRPLHGIVLGRYLADKLGAALEDTVLVFSPTGISSVFSQPLVQRFVVSGIFELGMFEYDDVIALVHLQDGARLFALD